MKQNNLSRCISIFIILTAAVLIFPLTCWSDEYVLVMSKNNDLCLHMLKLYNTDLNDYGYVKYNEHEEYKKIIWEEKSFFVPARTQPILEGPMWISKFDINNDNNVELVVKTGKDPVNGIDMDVIFIFKKGDTIYFIDNAVNAHILGNAISKIDPTVYELKELPPGKIEVRGFQVRGRNIEAYKGYYRLYDSRMYPFLYKNKYYLSLENHTKKEIDYKRWIVIFRYINNKKMEDICYFLKVLEQ